MFAIPMPATKYPSLKITVHGKDMVSFSFADHVATLCLTNADLHESVREILSRPEVLVILSQMFEEIRLTCLVCHPEQGTKH